MTTRSTLIIALAIILLMFAIGTTVYPQMPERVASHWNARGEVDGYMPKFWGLFALPLIMLGSFLLLLAIPKIDPLKANIEKFRGTYNTFVVLMTGFLAYVYGLTVAWNLGIRFDMVQLLVPAFGALFYYAGVLIENAKQNWFIGIRTPWTLSSERVWEKTHRIGGRLFKITAFLSLLGLLFPSCAVFFILVPLLLVGTYTVVYSYVEYQGES